MELELVLCKCMLVVSYLKMLEVNRRALFGYPRTQHLVRIILSSRRRSSTQRVDVRILNLTEYSTQMCYSVNTPPPTPPPLISSPLTEQTLAAVGEGTSARHVDPDPRLKAGSRACHKVNAESLGNLRGAFLSVCADV